jgi:hypothetical protein
MTPHSPIAVRIPAVPDLGYVAEHLVVFVPVGRCSWTFDEVWIFESTARSERCRSK